MGQEPWRLYVVTCTNINPFPVVLCESNDYCLKRYGSRFSRNIKSVPILMYTSIQTSSTECKDRNVFHRRIPIACYCKESDSEWINFSLLFTFNTFVLLTVYLLSCQSVCYFLSTQLFNNTNLLFFLTN